MWLILITVRQIVKSNYFSLDSICGNVISKCGTSYCCYPVMTVLHQSTCQPPHDKTNKMACAPSEDSDQPGHLPSLIRVFAVCMKKAWVLSYPLSTGCPGWLSLCWAHSHFVGFVMRQLIYSFYSSSHSFLCMQIINYRAIKLMIMILILFYINSFIFLSFGLNSVSFSFNFGCKHLYWFWLIPFYLELFYSAAASRRWHISICWKCESIIILKSSI